MGRRRVPRRKADPSLALGMTARGGMAAEATIEGNLAMAAEVATAAEVAMARRLRWHLGRDDRQGCDVSDRRCGS
jgi:hypothetical protein